jgi:hypothetical protein
VLQYYAVSGQEGVASGLKPVSIISDIERVGDYNKNVAKIAEDRPDLFQAVAAQVLSPANDQFEGQ